MFKSLILTNKDMCIKRLVQLPQEIYTYGIPDSYLRHSHESSSSKIFFLSFNFRGASKLSVI